MTTTKFKYSPGSMLKWDKDMAQFYDRKIIWSDPKETQSDKLTKLFDDRYIALSFAYQCLTGLTDPQYWELLFEAEKHLIDFEKAVDELSDAVKAVNEPKKPQTAEDWYYHFRNSNG